MPLDRFDVPFLTAGVVLLVAAGWILLLNFQDRLNRALGLSLVLFGGSQVFRTAVGEPGWEPVGRLGTYLYIGAPLALLYLAACYHERFANGRLRRPALPILVALGTLGTAGVIVGRETRNHGLLLVLSDVVQFLVLVGFSSVALVLTWDAVRDPQKPWRASLITLALAFAFFPTAFGLHFLAPALMNSGVGDLVASGLGLIPFIGVVILWVRLAKDAEPSVRSAARRALALLALAPVSVAMLILVQRTAPLATFHLAMTTVMAAWGIVFATIAAYSVARHQVFGIERRLKWTLNRGTIAGIFLATFALVTKLADAFAEQIVGGNSWILGGVAAAALGLALTPLQRLASRVADTAMPGVANSSAYESFRKVQMYQSALAAVWEDGTLRARERARLDRLRRKLGLTPSDASALERDFARLAGIANI